VEPHLAASGFAMMMINNSAWMFIAAIADYTVSEAAYTLFKQSLLEQIVMDGGRVRYAAAPALDFLQVWMIIAIFVMLPTYCSSAVLAILILVVSMTITVFLFVILFQLRTREAFP
tara:strand:+ start:985 stop:1332 length:348 start_codon:yes stop_codon:yes gene_type:complete